MKINKTVIIIAFSVPTLAFAASLFPVTYTNRYETVYIDEGKTLLRVDGRHEGEFVIAEGTEIIGRGAFSGCYALTSVIIPDSVTNIMEYAFSPCSSLTNVVFGSGVRTIMEAAFTGTSGLTSVDLPDSLETVGKRAFMTVPPKKIKVGSNLRTVGEYAFGSSSTLGTNSLDRFVTISPSNQWLRVEGTQVVPIKKDEIKNKKQ